MTTFSSDLDVNEPQVSKEAGAKRRVWEVKGLTHSLEHPAKMECGCLHGRVIENSSTRKPVTCSCTGVGAHTHLGDPHLPVFS